MKKQTPKQVNVRRVRDVAVDVSFKAVGGYKLSMKKIKSFFGSEKYNPDVIRSFILQFYELSVEEFHRYEKIWTDLQKHLKEKMYTALLLDVREKEMQKKIAMEKEGVKILIHALAKCYVKKFFGKESSHAVMDVFSRVIKTSYKENTLYRMMREEVNILEEEQNIQTNPKIKK